MPALEKWKQENQERSLRPAWAVLETLQKKKTRSGLFYILKFICAEVDAFGEAEAGGLPYITEK